MVGDVLVQRKFRCFRSSCVSVVALCCPHYSLCCSLPFLQGLALPGREGGGGGGEISGSHWLLSRNSPGLGCLGLPGSFSLVLQAVSASHSWGYGDCM